MYMYMNINLCIHVHVCVCMSLHNVQLIVLYIGMYFSVYFWSSICKPWRQSRESNKGSSGYIQCTGWYEAKVECLHVCTLIVVYGEVYLSSHYSIGVTTGVAFCGVVGHPERHEYTGMLTILIINFLIQYIISALCKCMYVHIISNFVIFSSSDWWQGQYGCSINDKVSWWSHVWWYDSIEVKPSTRNLCSGASC